ANVVALSGIAIAIGTMVDMGIVICENILRHLDDADPAEPRLEVIHRATSEVGGAVLTAVSTTIVGFLPVFAMTGAEGRLFKPLAFTKTFALIASVIVALTVIPAAAHLLMGWRKRGRERRKGDKARRRGGPRLVSVGARLLNVIAVAVVLVFLANHWEPLGPELGGARNLVFVGGTILGLFGFFWLAQLVYPRVLRWALDHKILALAPADAVVVLGLTAWLGFERVFGQGLRGTVLGQRASEAMPGLGKEFMPDLDEGSFLFMPTTMAHASIGEALDVLQFQNRAIASIPEIETVVGKIGRVDSALDPAPIGMIETVINYKPEYGVDADGDPVRQWREHIRSPNDIWDEIVAAARIPGTTSAPRLQPIAARLVMLQSGMRAPMGVKILGPDLETIERVALEVERLLKEVPGVKAEAVIADRIVGKPYVEIDLDRAALARYGLHIKAVQDVIEVAIGGKKLTTTVEGRERYPVRVRYARELRDDLESLGRILVPTPGGAQIQLAELAEIRFVRGPQAIKSEDTSLVGYVIFDKQPGWAEVDVVESCDAYLREHLQRPPGVRVKFAGTYENQIRAQKTLSFLLPLALLVIFVILYLQFRSVATTLIVWSGVIVAWGGGFVLVWLYGRPWFLDFDVFGKPLRALFHVEPLNLSVAVWVGFLALFGIATDNGVVLGTYLRQSFERRRPDSVAAIREATVEAGARRIRPCLMTTATTLLALLPVLSSTGRGSDIMVPMAIPSFGGMAVALLTMLVVPVLYCWVQEFHLWTSRTFRDR
ncbi:MAG: efflux RND transporter permease subunit, partial [Planctomycetota bacterium]|nr:efflux RND transporter permease subunit [Planctomycetota bacterium]